MIRLEKIKCKSGIATLEVVYKDIVSNITIDCISGEILSKSNDLSESTANRVRNRIIMLYIETGSHLPSSTGVLTH